MQFECVRVEEREGEKRRKVTGANQKGSPGCRGGGKSVVGKKQLHHLSNNNVPCCQCSRRFLSEKYTERERERAVKGGGFIPTQTEWVDGT